MQNLTIAFIGGGNMAEALIAGLRKAGHAGEHIHVAEPQQIRRDSLASTYQVITVENSSDAIKSADIVVLAMKPQQMKEAVAGIGVYLKSGASVISIAAGVGIATMREWLGSDTNIVRVMPNTPALVGAGMSALFSEADELHKLRAEYLLDACGDSVRVEKESQLHAVTAVSGSGPAYFFLLAEVLQASAEKLGLSQELAAKLAAQTALGAGKMLVESDRVAAELRHQVSSPGGTTQAALDVMYEAGFPDAVRKGVLAANKRSEELAG